MNKQLYILGLLLFFAGRLFAQANVTGLGFNYSALVRDAAGNPQPNTTVNLRFTLLPGATATAANSPWIETQGTKTDGYGFVNVTVGTGVKAGGTEASFTNVDFSLANYWLLIEVANAQNQYLPLAKQPLQAVPYAKVAGSVVGSSGVPPGTIVAFGGDSAHVPAGWMFCDGRTLSNSDPKYLPLFKAIGYSWGTDDNSFTFNIPYLQGLFLRGAYSLGYDPDADSRIANWVGGNTGNNVGSLQLDAVKYHKHDLEVVGDKTGPAANRIVAASYVSTGLASTTSGTLGEGFADETRPKNVYVTYIIKY